jgi:rod shape-determining protein MreD
LGAVLFHIIFFDFIRVYEVTPDLYIILIVFITLREGRFVGLLAGFSVGLIVDVIMPDVIGTNALTKTIAALMASFFYKEGKTAISKTLRSYKFILIVLLSALMHNIVYFFFYIKTSEQNFSFLYLQYGLATTIYTAFFAALMYFLQIPSNKIKY